MKKRIILAIIDGLGDETIPELNGTPLEYISDRLANMNKLAEEGLCGLMYPISPGIPPSSDTAHLTIFGYDLSKEYTGRGYFEALGAGIPIEEGDVAIRFNFATVKKQNNHLVVVDRRAGRTAGEEFSLLAKDLQEAINERGLPVEIHHTLEHRGVMIIKGTTKKLSRMVSDTDPHEVGVPVLSATPLEETPPDELEHAKRTAEIINEVVKLSYRIFDNHEVNIKREERGLLKANIILTRGAGIAIRMTPFSDKWGLRAAYIAAGPLYKGVARAVGMEEITVKGATGTVKTNINAKIEGTIKAFDSGYDFVFLHIKATDNLSHDKKPREKAEFILKIDHALEKLLDLDDIVIAITGDHSTSSLKGRHIGLPLPIVFWSDSGIRKDGARKFNERECIKKGGLGVLFGKDIMPLLLDLANRLMEYGIRTSPKQVLYTGAYGEPLKI